jgi:hypothetical protein
VPDCPDRKRISAEWRESVVKFADQVKRLAGCTGNRDGFLEQFHTTELAREHCEDIRRMLQIHRAEHGC